MLHYEILERVAERYEDARRERVISAGPAFAANILTEEPGIEARIRHVKKVQRLSRAAGRDKARAYCAEAENSATTVRSQKDVIDTFMQERVIGTSDFIDINFLELAISMSRAVARIKSGNNLGTGFLVGPGLLMTNNHVLPNVGVAGGSVAQFDYQENADGAVLPVHVFKLNPARFFVTHEELDVSVVAVDSASNLGRQLSAYPWVKLIAEIGKAEAGDPINIIQHPRGGFKQIAFRKNEVITIPQQLKDFLYYTTDTEPGSSGSPCFNDQWELVALHHSGVPARDKQGNLLKQDKSIWRKDVDPATAIDWVANEGARVSRIVAFLRDVQLKSESDELRDRMLDATPPNPIELARSSKSGQDGPEKSITGKSITMSNSHSWTIPLNITISVGGGPAEPVQIAELPAGDFEEKVEIDPDWKSRKGYDPDFLGFRVPLPALSASMQKSTVEVPQEFRRNGDKHILNYHNYSVAMNKRRRLAWYAAAAIDGDNRPNLGPRKGDKWFFDFRIDQKFQVGEEAYVDEHIDRGHVNRREDTAWGMSLDAARKANNDTFHFTNCTPQLSAFNQGQDRWQGLENFMLNKSKKEKRRMVVISGPVFASNDPLYRNNKMSFSLRIPLEFWKVCVLVRQDNSVAATAFILGQEDIQGLPGFEDEVFDAQAAQITIAELEEKTGLSFGNLQEHDHFAQGGTPGTLEVLRESGSRPVKPLRSWEDIVV